MAVRKIKNSKSEGEKLEEDFNVKTVVEKTLKEVEVKGDEAVRELSKKFDNFDRPNFLLTESEIDAAMQKFLRATWKISNLLKIRSEGLRKSR